MRLPKKKKLIWPAHLKLLIKNLRSITETTDIRQYEQYNIIHSDRVCCMSMNSFKEKYFFSDNLHSCIYQE